MNNKLIAILLAPLALFSFLFYVFWTYPVQILSQELPINEYFLFDNPYLQLSLLLCTILFLLLILFYKFLPKIVPYLLGIILVFLIGTFLYKITSYDFGTFIDNNSLTTSKAILGYNFWYFALDAIFPIISIIITIFALKKNFYKPILILFFIFYTTENILTFSKLKVTPFVSSNNETITLSSNHPNLLFFMFDALSTPIMLDIITNQWNNQQKEWTKDFTFYDNVTSLSLGGTILALPNIIGGYEFAPQKQIQDIIQNNIKIRDIDTQSLKFYPIQSYFQTDKSFEEVSKKLNHNIDISISYADSLIGNPNEIPQEGFYTYRYIPIINVSLYSYIPYLFRNNLVNNRLEIKTSFNWKNQFPIRWVSFFSSALVSSQKTDKPVFYYFENQGAHGPHDSPTYPNGWHPKSISDMKDILYHQITYNMRALNNLMRILKKQNIYDSTRIIVVTDHGTLPYNGFTLPYLQQISTSNQKAFYSLENNKFYRRFQDPPVFIMDKNFNTTQTQMQMDSRFLSLGDLHGTILNTFTNNSTIPDYLVTPPPKRAFNIPFIEGEVFRYYAGEKSPYLNSYNTFTNKYFKNNKLSFIKIKSIKEGDFEISSYDLDNIGDLPPFELLN